jgi:hypothetical protein
MPAKSVLGSDFGGAQKPVSHASSLFRLAFIELPTARPQMHPRHLWVSVALAKSSARSANSSQILLIMNL